MAITKAKKEAVLDSLKDIIQNKQTIVFVKFDGVTSEEANTLRGVCADEEVGYTVAKKTLIKRAFGDSSIDGDLPALDGEVALAYGSDLTAPARLMKEQGKALEGKVTIIGGVFEGAFVPQEKMQSIADIPSTKTLYAMFLNVIQAPVTGCVVALNQIAEKKG